MAVQFLIAPKTAYKLKIVNLLRTAKRVVGYSSAASVGKLTILISVANPIFLSHPDPDPGKY